MSGIPVLRNGNDMVSFEGNHVIVYVDGTQLRIRFKGESSWTWTDVAGTGERHESRRTHSVLHKTLLNAYESVRRQTGRTFHPPEEAPDAPPTQ